LQKASSKPPGDPHQNCTQFGDGRNGGLTVKRALSNFVRQHKQRKGEFALWEKLFGLLILPNKSLKSLLGSIFRLLFL
jgi:hypothetical protein